MANTVVKRIAELESALATERDRAAKGEAFKSWVHARLDQGGVPTHIDGPHSREGCRVGDRMDFVFNALATERAARERAETERDVAIQEAAEWISIYVRSENGGYQTMTEALESAREIVRSRVAATKPAASGAEGGE
jgi:hypothetical protein